LTLRILPDIVKVKNAYVVFDYSKGIYSLFHYDTEIAQININGNKVIKALKCSSSSTRAIYQLTDYLNIDRKSFKLIPFKNFTKVNSLLSKQLGDQLK
jgi:hypothetical protein